jgi:hypothetical protein
MDGQLSILSGEVEQWSEMKYMVLLLYFFPSFIRAQLKFSKVQVLTVLDRHLQKVKIMVFMESVCGKHVGDICVGEVLLN